MATSAHASSDSCMRAPRTFGRRLSPYVAVRGRMLSAARNALRPPRHVDPMNSGDQLFLPTLDVPRRRLRTVVPVKSLHVGEVGIGTPKPRREGVPELV